MIKAIIFDFGDVFINLDKEGTNKKLKEMNIDDFLERPSAAMGLRSPLLPASDFSPPS